MNAWPTLRQWLEFGGVVSLELLLLFAIAKLISLRVQSAQRRRCLWQVVLVATLLVVGGELSGVREMVRLPQSSPKTEKVVPQARTVVVTIKDAEFPIDPAPVSFASSSNPSPPLTTPLSAWQQRTRWPGFLWASITILLLGRILLGQILSLSFRVSARRRVDADLQTRTVYLADLLRIRRRVTIAMSANALVPFTFGVWRPVIVLPARFTEIFVSEQQDAALAHELAHVAGLDSAWRALSNFTCAVLWWSPFGWLAKRELEHASELVADESSLLLANGPSSLAESLVVCAKTFHAPTAISWLGMDGGGFRSSLGQRVSRLLQLNPQTGVTVRVPWYVRLILPMLCALGLWFAMALVTRDLAAPSQTPWQNSLLGSALAALAEPAKGDPSEANRIAVARLIQDGKLYYESGRLKEAEDCFQAAIKLEPGNARALDYLTRIRYARLDATESEKRNAEERSKEPKHERPANLGRAELFNKLRSIRLPEWGPFKDLPLSDVIRDLNDAARILDPGPGRVNFFISPNAGFAAQPTDSAIAGATIRLATPLKNISLEHILNILVTIADRGLKYSVEDHGVVISLRLEEPGPPLHTRFFKVDPKAFAQSLRSVIEIDSNSVGSNYVIRNPRLYDSPPNENRGEKSPRGGISFLREVTPAETLLPELRSFFNRTGVDLSNPGKAVFYNDRLGTLMVRATLQDLDTVEKAVQMFNMYLPQLTIQVKVMEVPVESSQRTLGQFGFTNAPRSTETPVDFALSVTNGFQTTNRPSPSITGILTDEQFRKLIADMEKTGGTDLLSAPAVTTMSGRQAQIKVVDVRYIVTDIDYSTNGLPAGSAPEPRPMAEPFEIGPVIDIVPYVEADGYTIQMNVLPTLREFLGYAEDPFHRANDLPATGGPLAPRQVTPLPQFRLRQVASAARVWDGQTLVLGAGNARKMEPVRHANGTFTTNYADKALFFFITPRLIDPAGNPLHSNEELGMRKNIPEQKPKPPVNKYE